MERGHVCLHRRSRGLEGRGRLHGRDRSPEAQDQAPAAGPGDGPQPVVDPAAAGGEGPSVGAGSGLCEERTRG
eukprot:756334-Hanusia_phi.AAC.1